MTIRQRTKIGIGLAFLAITALIGAACTNATDSFPRIQKPTISAPLRTLQLDQTV